MSITSGLRSGLRSSVRSGLNPGASAITWTVDATSTKSVPANSSEWTDFIAYNALSVAVPNSLWLCQEASGNLADSIGSLTLTAFATPLYQQSVSGWTRKGVGFTDTTVNQRFTAASGTGPDPGATSVTFLWLMSVTATPASTRTQAMISDTGTTQFTLRVLTTPALRAVVFNVNANGTDDPTNDGIQPMALKYDRVNSEAKVYTGVEKIAGTYNAGVLDGHKGIGGGNVAGVTPATGQCVYGCMWSGANAAISDANMKALLVAMGFSIPWS